MVRDLIHYRRRSAALIACAAVATAALSGALLVGDSLHGSLRTLALDRLGPVEAILHAPDLVPEDLAQRLQVGTGGRATAVPVLAFSGAAEEPGSGRLATGVQVLAVDRRFRALFPELPAPPWRKLAEGGLPPVLLNRVLARELQAVPGDHVLLRLPPSSGIHPESLVGRASAGEVVTVRLEVADVVPAQGAGGFSLGGPRTVPSVAFVPLEHLQRAIGEPGRVNAILAAWRSGTSAGGLADELQEVLRRVVDLEDLRVHLRRGSEAVVVESPAFFLPRAVAEAVETLAAAWDTPTTTVLAHLANEINSGNRSIPYSMVAALDPAAADLRRLDGSRVPAIPPGGILLNDWAARELRATRGDPVALRFFSIDERNRLRTEGAELRLQGVVRMSGTAADPSLTPEIPGIAGAPDMMGWDPPFPIELDRLRPQDEEYWDRFRATPKGFVSPATGRRLWETRFGAATSIRLAPGRGGDGSPATLEQIASRLQRELPRRVDPATIGLSFRDVRTRALQAAEGSTDFGALFLGFSAFLIASAALLLALVFGLAVQERAEEVGILLALGFTRARVRRRFLAQGLVAALVGVVLGSAVAVGHAALLVSRIRGGWLTPVAGPGLELHVAPGSLLTGAVAATVVVAVALLVALRRLRSVSIRGVLSGRAAAETRAWSGAWPTRVTLGALGATLGLLAWQVALGGGPPGAAFATGGAALVAGLGGYARWCTRGRRRNGRRPGASVTGLAVRNASWAPGRSVFGAGVVAGACFVLVTVAIHRRGPEDPRSAAGSAAHGGFTLMATSSVPLHHDPGTAEGRRDLGLSPAVDRRLAGHRVASFRLKPGDDASCLNPYRPRSPRVLGVPRTLIDAAGGGGFRFGPTLAGREGLPEGGDPWDLLAADLGPGVVPAIGDAESVRWILRSGLGQELELTGPHGEPVRLRLVALLKDSIFQSELLVAEDRFLEHFGDQDGFGFFLFDPPPSRAEGLAGALERDLARFGFDARPAAERLSAYHSVRRVYLGAFQLLGGFGLGLGILGLGVIVARNLVERAAELATLRAIGFSRRQLVWMVGWENASVVLAGIGVGCLAGLLASWPHLQAAESAVSWSSVALSLGAIAGTGLLASVSGALRLLTMPLTHELRRG